MKHLTAITIVFSVTLAGSTFAQDNDRQNERRLAPFPQFFTLRGIEFSEEQQSKVEQLRKEFVPKLAKNQDRWNRVVTKEQQQARREAFQKAQDAGTE